MSNTSPIHLQFVSSSKICKNREKRACLCLGSNQQSLNYWLSVLPLSYWSFLQNGPQVRTIPYLQVWKTKTFLSLRSGQFQVKNNSSTIQNSNSSAIQKSDLYFCQRRTGGVCFGISKQDRFKSNSRGFGVVFRVWSGCSHSAGRPSKWHDDHITFVPVHV